MNRKCVEIVAVSLLVLSRLQAQDAKIVADNIEFSREFYSGVHFSAIAESVPSFGYQRYPDNGPERIQCDQGTFARKQHGKPWLKSEDWGETGQPVDKQTAQKLDGWVKLLEAAFNIAPSEVKPINKSEAEHRVQWIFQARGVNEKAAPVRLTFAKPLYDKNPNVLLHGFEGPLPIAGGKTPRSERVKFSFGYLIAQGGYELSEALWENLETPKELENKPIDLSKFDMGPKPKDAEGFVQRANARGFNGDVNGAISDFGRAIDLDPKLTSAYYQRGIARLEKGEFDAAIGDLNRAIELSPNTSDYYNDRGLAKLRKGDNDAAIGDFTRAVELDPKNALAYRNRALAKSIKKDPDGALADYNRAIEADPKNAGAFNSRGMIRKAKGDLDGAIADFSSAIGLNDKLAIAYKNRGDAKQAKGDASGAKEDLKRAGELAPELMSKEPVADSGSNRATAAASPSPAASGEADHYYASGLKKQNKGDLDGAIADYTRAIELNSKYTEAFNNRGNVKGAKEDHDGAIADLSRAIELDPKHTISYNNRGAEKMQKGDFDGAITDFNSAIELNPGYANAYHNRAYAKDKTGDSDGAMADLERAIKLNSKDASAYDLRGDIKANKKQYAAAIMDEQKAIALDPKNGDYYLSLGWYQLFNHKPRESITASLKALKLSPDDTVMIKGNLAHAYLFDNQFEKAKTIYLENKNAKLHDGRAFSQAVLDDFKELQEVGITHPDIEKVKALLTTKTQVP